jgi:hypothetical protein
VAWTRPDAREVEEGVDELEEAEAVAVRGAEALAAIGGERVGALCEFVFEWAEHEGEWGAKFVADVGEKGGLGAVDFREGFGAFAFLLIRAGVGDGGGDVSDEQIVKGAIGVVKGEARADAGDERTYGLRAAGGQDWKRQGLLDGLRVGADAELTEPAGEIFAANGLGGASVAGMGPCGGGGCGVESDSLEVGQSAGFDAAIGGEASLAGVVVEQVEEDEGEIKFAGGKGLRRESAGVLHGLSFSSGTGEIAEAAGAALAEHSAGCFGDGMKKAADGARLVANGTEREGKAGFLEVAVAVEEHALIFEERGFASGGAVEGVADHGPRCGPTYSEILTHGDGMLCAADGPVAVVVKLDVVGSPNQRDRKVRGEAKPDGGAEALRPGFDRAERGLAPIHGANELAHFATADEPIFGAGECDRR